MPDPFDLVLRPSLVIPARELSWQFSRSSGPGGQHVNTSDTAVAVSFDVARSPSLPEPLRARALATLHGQLVDGVLTATASEFRSQWRNREAAAERLASRLREAVAPPTAPRRPTRPTRGAREARLAAKHRRAQVKRSRGAARDPDE